MDLFWTIISILYAIPVIGIGAQIYYAEQGSRGHDD